VYVSNELTQSIRKTCNLLISRAAQFENQFIISLPECYFL